MSGVDGSTLDSVRGAGVGELDVMSDVRRRKGHLSPAVRSPNSDAAVLSSRRHDPVIAVPDPTARRGQPPFVLASHDLVAHASSLTLGDVHAVLAHDSGRDPIDSG